MTLAPPGVELRFSSSDNTAAPLHGFRLRYRFRPAQAVLIIHNSKFIIKHSVLFAISIRYRVVVLPVRSENRAE